MLDREKRLSALVDGLAPNVRRFLLEAMMAPQGERAELIGRLHEYSRTPELVELLIDLEGNPTLRLELADALKADRPG